MEWRVIASHPAYEVSSAGEVRRDGKVLKTWSCRGYKGIALCMDSIQTKHRIHRLMALAFIPNPENKQEVDHINRIRHDNRVENLRWATRSENQSNINVQINNKLGHQHIRLNHGSYQVRIYRNGGYIYDKWFKDLDEAIMERDLFLLFL
jgi:hypothetical protein